MPKKYEIVVILLAITALLDVIGGMLLDKRIDIMDKRLQKFENVIKIETGVGSQSKSEIEDDKAIILQIEDEPINGFQHIIELSGPPKPAEQEPN